MRIKNKELRQRRHRKEQVIKAANKALAAQFPEKKTPSGEKKPTAPKREAAPKSEAKKAPKKAAE